MRHRTNAIPARSAAPPIPPTTPPMIFLDEAEIPDELDLSWLDGKTPGVTTEVATPVVMEATDVTADAIVVV